MSTRKTKRDYAQERLDPRWQKKRLDIMNRDSFACCDCGDENTTLNVHHRYYVTGRKPWEYPDWSFQTLCYPCHQAAHNNCDYDDPDDAHSEQPWECYLEWLDFAILGDDINSFQAWDQMVELSKIMRAAYDVSLDHGRCIMSVLLEIKTNLESQLKGGNES